MATQSALLVIADTAGHTRFMKFHAASLVHAQDVVGQPLEAMIDAATRSRGASLPTDVDDLGCTPTWYLPLALDGDGAPAPQRHGLTRRFARHLLLMRRSVPHVTGRLRACDGLRNLAQ